MFRLLPWSTQTGSGTTLVSKHCTAHARAFPVLTLPKLLSSNPFSLISLSHSCAFQANLLESLHVFSSLTQILPYFHLLELSSAFKWMILKTGSYLSASLPCLSVASWLFSSLHRQDLPFGRWNPSFCQAPTASGSQCCFQELALAAASQALLIPVSPAGSYLENASLSHMGYMPWKKSHTHTRTPPDHLKTQENQN